MMDKSAYNFGQFTYQEINQCIQNTDKEYIGFYFINFDLEAEHIIHGNNLEHLNSSNHSILWFTPGYIRCKARYVKENELDLSQLPKHAYGDNFYWYFNRKLYFKLVNQFSLGQIEGGVIIIFNKKYWSTDYIDIDIKDEFYFIEVSPQKINQGICDKKLYKNNIEDTVKQIEKKVKTKMLDRLHSSFNSVRFTYNWVGKEFGLEFKGGEV